MLKTHIDDIENYLLHLSKIPGNSGHTLHRGTPREWFIKEFLRNHLAETINIGTGEIIDSNSKPRELRNQIDIILYKKNYPKLDLGGGINCFLAESVVATIEVKSRLTKKEIFKAFDAIRNIKNFKRNSVQFSSAGYQPPSIISTIVAYDGPSNMETIKGWIDEYYIKKDISNPNLPPSYKERITEVCPLSDLIVVIGKGFIQYDNGPVSFLTDKHRTDFPASKWLISQNSNGNLTMLFTHLTSVISSNSIIYFQPLEYLKTFTLNNPPRFS